MTVTSGPNLDLLIDAAPRDQYYLEFVRFLRGVDGLMQCRVKDKDLTAPPAEPVNGDMYIVGTAATGAWAGQSGKLARYFDVGASAPGWEFYSPRPGWSARVEDELSSGVPVEYVYSGTAWVVEPGGGGAGVASIVAGDGIDVDNTDPANPIVSATGGAVLVAGKCNLEIQDAIWSWWAKPIFLRHKSKSYLSHTLADGRIAIAQYDYNAGRGTRRFLSDSFTPDDHNAGCVVADDDAVVCFFPGRRHVATENAIYYYESATSDIADLGAVQTLSSAAAETNYPNAYRHDDALMLIYRGEGATGNWYARTNTWPMSSWSSEVNWFDSSRVWGYFATRRSSDNPARINFVLGWHPENESHADLYVGYFDGESATPWDIVSDGGVIGNLVSGTGLPVNETDMEIAYAAGVGEKTRLIDLHDNCFVFASYTGDASDAMYKFARWTGSAWAVSDIVATGRAFNDTGRHYFGGIAIDEVDVNKIYVSREDAGEWYLEEWRSEDDGATWALYNTLSRSVQVTARPICESISPADTSALPSLKLGYFSGYYNQTGNTEEFATNLHVGLPGAPVAKIATRELAVGETITLSAYGEVANIPIKMSPVCQYRIRAEVVGGPAASASNSIGLLPNGNTYTTAFSHETVTARGATLSSAEGTTNYFQLTSQSGEQASIDISIAQNSIIKKKTAMGTICGLWGDGTRSLRNYYGLWNNTSVPWETIGALQWFNATSSAKWMISITRLL